MFSINTFKNNQLFKDLFDIKSFVIVFAVFSFISISSADMVYNKTRKIKNLNKKLESLKAEYVSTRTMLMTKSKRSVLLKKAEAFGLIESNKPVKTIYFKNED